MKTLKRIEKSGNSNLIVFNSLCDRAKELIFNTLEDEEGCLFFYICNLNEDLIKMSPIEQILYICNDIYEVIRCSKIYVDLEPQHEISIGNKNYRCDFYINNIVLNKSGEKTINRPLIIELDGYDYNSNKKQMNYDYERENELKLAGYDIMRFTGSQVYNNPLECIENIVKYCKQNGWK